MKSWGNIFSIGKLVSLSEFSRSGEVSFSQTCIFGNKRSYGDQATLPDGLQYNAKQLNHFINFDEKKGILRAEGGVLISEILGLIVPKGWTLQVTPGTKFVTLGGAVANNIHGKNHHTSGSFGNFVKSIGLFRTDKGNLKLSRTENVDLFEATLGGSGLTGLITWVEIKLKKLPSEYLHVQNIRFKSVEEFFKLSEQSNSWEYTVAWVDCMPTGKMIGRGVFSRANFVESREEQYATKMVRKFKVPRLFPSFLLNKFTIKTFNFLYYNRPSSSSSKITHFDAFFYPLDKMISWNNLYGRRGFYQFQCIIPNKNAVSILKRLLSQIALSGQGSFLAVMKVHGAETSPGINNFCMPGCSLALDFKNKGQQTVSFLKELEEIVLACGGRIYLAKDALMSCSTFKQMYPNWTLLNQLKDPKLSSQMWERLTGE